MVASRRVSFVLLASAAVSVAACFDSAADCKNTLSCSPPDAGTVAVQGAPPGDPCEGQCVPGSSENWDDPHLVWLGDEAAHPMCPPWAPIDYFHGVAPGAAPPCGECTCQAPTGSCVFPTTATANTGSCSGAGSGTAFDPPSPWDGSCTTYDAVAGSVQSVTVASLDLTENGCMPGTPVATQDWPSSPTFAQGCGGTANGQCRNAGDICKPATPSSGMWTYCIGQKGAGDAYTSTCPSQYPHLYVFAVEVTDTRSCSPCTCGPPEGSACSSLISVYADDACSQQLGAVTATSSASMCVDIPAGSPLGSKAASSPVYEPGVCSASGGALTGSVTYDGPTTLCCLH